MKPEALRTLTAFPETQSIFFCPRCGNKANDGGLGFGSYYENLEFN